MWAWILTFTLYTGTVEIYAVYNTLEDCAAQASIMQPVVEGRIDCVAVNYKQS